MHAFQTFLALVGLHLYDGNMKEGFKDYILMHFREMQNDIIMLEDGQEIFELLEEIKVGDGEGPLTAGGITTMIVMPIHERALRTSLFNFILHEISSEAKQNLLKYKTENGK